MGAGGLHQASGDWYAAAADWEAALELRPNDARLMNATAWVLATAPDEYARNGPRAVKLAISANESSQSNGAYLDTLAAALAEAGRFDEATDRQRAAIALLPARTVQAGGYEERLQSYLSGRPWRQLDSPRQDNGQL